MDPPPKRRGRPRKTNIILNNEVQTNNTNDESIVPKIENLLTMNTMVVEQRKAAKARKKCIFF
ncbi:unnamed protein product, partial [Rotaria sordida]